MQIGHLPADTPAQRASMPIFQDDVDAVLKVGRLIVSFRRLYIAIRDPRLQRRHLVILSHFMDQINHETGTAFPGRQSVADAEQLSIKTIENACYELRNWGYLVWQRRGAPGLHAGKLLHYTLPAAQWSEDEIKAGIATFVEEQRKKKVPCGPGTSGRKSTRHTGEFESTLRAGEFSKSTLRAVEKSTLPAGVSNLPREPTDRESARAKNSASKKRASSKSEKSRLPEDWTCPPDWRAYAGNEGAADFQIDFMAKGFHRYWTGPDAKNALKADWKRTWENWVDREIAAETLPRHPPKGSANGWHPQRPEGMPDEVWEARLAELAEEHSS